MLSRDVRIAPLWIALVLLLGAGPAAGVVYHPGDGTGNDTAPPDDFGFDHLGVVTNKLNVVYLGWRWVLTANHVGEQDVTLMGNVYSPVAGSSIRLSGPDPSIKPDLRVYRLQQGPTLPVLALSSTPATVGEEVHCIGDGWNREAGLTSWNAAWQELPPFIYSGYKRGVGQDVRWGRNVVSDADFDQELQDINGNVASVTRAFATTFDESGGPADEFQVVSGDSGGGCFAKRGGDWELTGVLFARSQLLGQDPNTAVFGNQSLIADVDFYVSQIQAIISPAIPALGWPWGLGLAALLLASGRAAGATPKR